MNTHKLKGKLREKGLTQEQAAKIAGCSPSNFNEKLNGSGGGFRLKEAEQLYKALELTPEECEQIFFS